MLNILNYGEYYNRKDIEKRVEEYHNDGMNDEEIIEQINDDANVAKESEHDFHSKDRRY